MTTGGGQTRLLERIAQGDASAVRDVIDLYGDLVWSLARRFTNSDADAEEAVQDIFVTLWRKAGHYDREIGSEVTFVSVLARRLLIDRWRRAARRPRLGDMEDHAGGGDTASAAAERDELAAAAAAAFEELTEEQRVVLRLSIEFGCTHEMIAELTGYPLGTVKTRIRLGLKRIRERVEQGRVSTGALR